MKKHNDYFNIKNYVRRNRNQFLYISIMSRLIRYVYPELYYRQVVYRLTIVLLQYSCHSVFNIVFSALEELKS